jgi:SWI/SNF-related matrix-associated actin-dependent regulator of chromatin subfamily A-like protein 1
MGTKALPYQTEGAIEIENFGGRALVGHEMGLGKSYISLLWAKWTPEARPIIIVCPASLKWNWERECSIHFGWKARVLEGTKPPEGGLSTLLFSIFIINYDILGPWLPFLKGIKPQLIIGDEVQAVKERGAKKTKNFKELCRGIPYTLCLSGTPAMNRPKELWNVLNILKPKVFKYARPFHEQFCKPRWTPWGWKFDGASNLTELNKILCEHVLVRKLKKDVLKQLPPKRYMVVPLEIEDRKQYERAVNQFILWLTKISTEKARRAMHAQAVVKVGYLTRLAAELKLKSVMEWIDNFLEDTDEKLIVFGVHRKIIHTLYERYPGISVVIDGNTPAKERLELTDKFNHGKKTRIMIGNIEAAGKGLNMTAASNVAMVELPWRPADVSQAVDRSHRLGQTKQVDCYFLVARETIETKLCEILQKKQHILSEILDGESGGDLNILDQLMESLNLEHNHNEFNLKEKDNVGQ